MNTADPHHHQTGLFPGKFQGLVQVHNLEEPHDCHQLMRDDQIHIYLINMIWISLELFLESQTHTLVQAFYQLQYIHSTAEVQQINYRDRSY